MRGASRRSASRTNPITASSTPTITGAQAFVARCRSVYQRTTGAVLAPMSAFLLLQGIETVALRVERHVENARKVAEFLRADPRVEWVNYAGFPDSPFYPLAQKYLGGRASVAVHLRNQGRHGRRQGVLRRAEARQAARQYRRRQVAVLPPGLDHPSADDRRTSSSSPAFAPRRSASASASSTSATSSRISTRRWRRRGGSPPRAGRGVSVMPVAIERLSPETVAQISAVRERRVRRGSLRDRGRRIEIALINNMPDAALLATERQFANLLDRRRRARRRAPAPVRVGRRAALARGARRAQADLSRRQRAWPPAHRCADRHRRRAANARPGAGALLGGARPNSSTGPTPTRSRPFCRAWRRMPACSTSIASRASRCRPNARACSPSRPPSRLRLAWGQGDAVRTPHSRRNGLSARRADPPGLSGAVVERRDRRRRLRQAAGQPVRCSCRAIRNTRTIRWPANIAAT